MKTVRDYLDNGYRVDDAAYQRGYVSRKADIHQSEVMIAGGSRKGQPYFLGPCFHSSQYCLRHYLVKD